MVPEVTTAVNDSPRTKLTSRNDYPSVRLNGATVTRLPVGTHQSLRVFPADIDGPVGDAARAWAGGAVPMASSSRQLSEMETSQHRDAFVASSTMVPSKETGPPLPFDMEFSVYSGKAVDEVSAVLAVPESTQHAVDDDNTEQATKDARDAVLLMQRIETDRIPCPRLCGATFGPGVGGLALFNNGGLRKMWKWWEKTDPVRSAASTAPGIIGELLRADEPESSRVKRDCPRTLKDLIDMTSAAKEAQWGDQDESEVSSAGFHAPGPSFFEDASDASTDSGDEDLDDKDLYESYFGGSQRPLVEGSPASRETPETQTNDKKASDQFGPASDALSPFVSVTRQYDKLALSNQSVELAKRWKLGKIAGGCSSLFERASEFSNPDDTTPAVPPPLAMNRAATGGESTVRYSLVSLRVTHSTFPP